MIVNTHDGMTMYDKEDGLVTGLVPAIPVDVEDTPKIKWQGAKLPRKLYLQTVAFAKWVCDTHGGCEVQGRLYYSESKKQWRVAVLPQYIKPKNRTLHAEEIKEHPLREKALSHVTGDDWVQHGTWHSHGRAGAGQSKDDYDNEMKQAGLHYTVGSLGDEYCSFHCRYMFRGLMYKDMDAKQFVNNPKALMSKCTSFPKQWRQMLFKDERNHEQVRDYGFRRVRADTDRSFGSSPQRGFVWINGVKMSMEEYREHIRKRDSDLQDTLRANRNSPSHLMLDHTDSMHYASQITDPFAEISVIRDVASVYREPEGLVEAMFILAKQLMGTETGGEGIIAVAEYLMDRVEELEEQNYHYQTDFFIE